MHLDVYIAFVCSFAYHRGWSAQLEVLDQFARLLLQITEFVANVKAIKRLGTNLQILKSRLG